MAKSAPSQEAFKIVQASFDIWITFRGSPFLANIQSRYVPNSWLLSGRIKMMVGDMSDVSSEPFHGFVDVVGRSWPRGAELEPLVQEGSSSDWDSGLFAEVVVGGVGGASLVISGGHLAVIVFDI